MEASVGLHVHLIHHLEGLDQRREIGRGSFGAVYEVKMNGLPCIAKGLHDILLGRGGNLPVREADKEAIRAKFHKECALLGNLKHPNIVQFLGVHRSKDNDEWLVMEYLHMDLAKCLEMYPDIPLPLKLSILWDVSYGLLHLHSQASPIIHRDLTAPNILLTQGMSAKIADLGVSKIFDIRQVQRSAHTAAPGTWAYMPPEALSPDPKYDAKLDVFSYGVLTLYVANQEFPIVHEPPIPPLVTKKQEIQIYKRKHWVDKMGVAHPLYSVVMSCLKDHPDHRPTSKELNDIITKLCTQHDNSCKNVLELIKENEEHKSQRRKLEMEIELKTQQVQSDNLCKELENRKVVMSDQRVLELQRELEMTKRSMKAENDKLKMDIEEHIGKCKDNHCKELENRKMVMSDQRVLELQRELEMTKISMKAENDKLKMEIKEYIGKFEALKQIIEKSNEEKIQNQRKLDQLGKEIEWLQNKSSRKSSSSTHEDYIRTLKGHVASLEEDIARLNQVIESKNRLISELDLKSIHVDTCTSRWNEDDIHEGLREHGHTCVPQDGRLAEGSNDANSNGLLQKLKAAEERMMAMEESYQSALIKIEVITAERDIFSDDFRKERDDRSRVVGEKGQVASELEAAQQKISEMSAKLSGAMKEKDHLSAGLRQSTDEHNRAKEEIAVKVAQVKQYQKQVEAYKQQLEQNNEKTQAFMQQLDQMNMLKEQAEKKLTEVMRGSDTKKPMDLEFKPSFRSKPMDLEFKPSFRSGTPIAASHFSTPEDDSAAGIGTSLRVIRCNDLDTGLGTGLGNIVSPHTCLPASVAGMQQHPLSAPPTGSDRVPSPRIFSPQPPPHAGPPSLDNLPHPSAMAGSQGIAYPTLDQHQDEHVGSGDPTAPPDPNLTCPLCRLVFKKREIRLHAQECKYLK